MFEGFVQRTELLVWQLVLVCVDCVRRWQIPVGVANQGLNLSKFHKRFKLCTSRSVGTVHINSGLEIFGGLGGVDLFSQILGTVLVILFSSLGALLVYGLVKLTIGFRLDEEEEFVGGDISIHRVSSSSDKATDW